uniref:hypothetical protein n=1 Tax=Streptomyces phytophilus TaxID=722715 RepID=UPI00215D61C6
PADTPDEPDPSGPAPTETPTTPPPDTSSPPDPTDPPREGPGGLLCLDVELGWLVDLDLCVL